MSGSDWTVRPAREIAEAVTAGATTAREVCRTFLDRAELYDPSLHAFETLASERALARAEALDREGPRGRLAGVPIALKDNICTRGLRTTAGSRVLGQYHPPYDAAVVERLEAAGAVVIGKTVCDEFAMGSSTDFSASGPARNPWSLDRTPGGSSGGSAAAVAARLSPVALGSDTGGSIRQPAGLTGVVGLKPTYGRVSRYGLIAFGSSLDQIGPMSWNVADAAALLSVIATPDPRDAVSSPEAPPDFSAGLDGDVRGRRIGVPRSLLEEGVDAEVSARFGEALDALRERGAVLLDVELPHAPFAISTYYLVATAEASSNLARYDGVRYGYRAPDADTLHELYERTRRDGFGPEVKRRIMLGAYVLSAGYYDAYYLKAQQVRTLIRRDYDIALATVDVVAMPTSPTPAFRLGERTHDPLQLYLADIFTVSANLAGLPAISVPCGFTDDGLPVGLQLTGRMWDEATLLGIAAAYERDQPWGRRIPTLAEPTSDVEGGPAPKFPAR